MQYESLTREDLCDIQAGPVVSFPTIKKIFYIFRIVDQGQFRQVIRDHILPIVTNSLKARECRQTILKAKAENKPKAYIPMAATNIAFSQKGLKFLSITDFIGDEAFTIGQAARAESILGDDIGKWREAFTTEEIHGIFIITGSSDETVGEQMSTIKNWLGDTAKGLYRQDCSLIPQDYVLPTEPPMQLYGDLNHFGWSDGFSTTFVKFEDDEGRRRRPYPGQIIVNPGVIITGQPGDTCCGSRPGWATNGSLVAYRHFRMYGPEFQKFLEQTVWKMYTDPRATDWEDQFRKDVELLGARMNGRWKSGAPIVLAPYEDDCKLGRDNDRNNNFRDYPVDQLFCPFAAHTRKTGPRSDISPSEIERHAIVRGGMHYGPKAKPDEKTTEFDRGLAFACYQSSLLNGFEYIQRRCNNPDVPQCHGVDVTLQARTQAGLDPMIGQGCRKMSGYDQENLSKVLDLPLFSVVEGGEYFFLPSISGLRQLVAEA